MATADSVKCKEDKGGRNGKAPNWATVTNGGTAQCSEVKEASP